MKKLLWGLVGLASIGCGAASDPGYTVISRPSVIASEPGASDPASPEAPRETVIALQTCVDHYAYRLSSDSYAVLYDIEATKLGITAVKVKDSMLANSDLEACLTKALERMDVPATALNTQQRATPQSRSMVGIVQAAAAPIAMMPIILVAGGVTILVGVTIYVAAEAEKERERCKQVKAECISSCTDVLMPSGQPDGMPYHECLRKCLEAQNCWKIFDRISPGY